MKKILLITITSILMASCGNVTEYFRGKLDGNKDKERIDSLQNALSQMEQRLEASNPNDQIAEVSPDAPEIFTLVYAISSDGFVNVRQSQSSSSPILGEVLTPLHGLGNGVKRGKSGKWTLVSVGKVTGWCYSKYLGEQNWYSGHGNRVLIANKPNTPIYVECYEEGIPYTLFTTVKQGTIIADEFTEDNTHYILSSAHDALFISKTDAIVRAK